MLVIDGGYVRIEDAADLWGLTCRTAETRLQKRFGPGWQFAVIGPAGERQVRFATISHDGRHAGRGGSGAVLGSKGVKVIVSGRLGGAEMSRCEKAIAGSMPLSTLRAKIDYGFCEAPTAQGNIGIQVWVNQGMYEETGDGADAQEGQAPKKPKRSYKR